MAIKVDDVYCRDCGEEEVYMDVKEEPSVYKIGAYCHGCNLDYGVVDRVGRSRVEHTDEVFEIGEQSIEELLEQ